MSTNKLYYDNAFLTECRTKIRKIEECEDGTYEVYLDSTILYPEGGGQPSDTGYINNIPIKSVREKDNDVIHIVIEKPEPEEVTVTLDWKRRFDHMQQHTGQHILSAVFSRLFDADTISFHMGSEVSHIDLNMQTLTQEQLSEAEKLANETVVANRTVTCLWVGPDELKNYNLRKGITKEFEEIRLVDVSDIDCCPCGGTHVDRTGSIGLIKIVGTEHKNKALRLYFLCGSRALKDYQHMLQIVSVLSNKLTVPSGSLLEAYDKQVEKYEILSRELSALKQDLNVYRAQEFFLEAVKVKGMNIIIKEFTDVSPQDISDLAKVLINYEKTIVLFASVNTSQNKVHLLFTRSSDVELNMNAQLKAILPIISGKGGGTPQTSQGGGTDVDKVQLALNEALENLKNL